MIVIGVGNPLRGDDAAGPEVARRVSGAVVHDAAALLDLFAADDHVVIVDAARSGAPAGTVHRLDADALGSAGLRFSTHAFGVAEAVGLGRALGRLPERLEVYAIEGAGFDHGAPLSPPARRAVAQLVAELQV
jgi:hydrogenase maturation protease